MSAEKKSRRWAALGAMACLTACTAYPPGVPSSQVAPVHRISVQPFQGDVGGEVKRVFLQSVTGTGFEFVDRKKDVQAALLGTVTHYKAGQKRILILGDTNTMASNGQTVAVSNPLVSPGSSQAALQNVMAGKKNPHMVAEHAAVGLAVRLVEVPSGRVLWAEEFSYESLELPRALQAVITSVSRSFQRAAPSLKHRQPNIEKG